MAQLAMRLPEPGEMDHYRAVLAQAPGAVSA